MYMDDVVKLILNKWSEDNIIEPKVIPEVIEQLVQDAISEGRVIENDMDSALLGNTCTYMNMRDNYKLSNCFFFLSNSSCVIAPMSSKSFNCLISS